MNGQPLVDGFLEGLGGEVPAHGEAWAEKLGRLLAEARARFPGLGTSAAAYGLRLGVAARLELAAAVERKRALSPAAVLERLAAHGSDLYLAAACGEGDSAALAVFERDLIPRVPAMIARLRCPQEVVEEVVQEVRCRLLTEERGPARIAQYQGRAPLAGWVRVVAIRAALDRLQARDSGGPERRPIDLPGLRDPELEALKRRYLPELLAALTEALRTLPPEPRSLLRMKYRARLAQNEIARILGVHEGTVSRRLTAACGEVLAKTKQILRQRLGISSAEFESLERDLQSQLDISLEEALGDEEDLESDSEDSADSGSERGNDSGNGDGSGDEGERET